MKIAAGDLVDRGARLYPLDVDPDRGRADSDRDQVSRVRHVQLERPLGDEWFSVLGRLDGDVGRQRIEKSGGDAAKKAPRRTVADAIPLEPEVRRALLFILRKNRCGLGPDIADVADPDVRLARWKDAQSPLSSPGSGGGVKRLVAMSSANSPG